MLTRTGAPPGRYTICTSSTRPSSPAVGDRIFETDTGKELTYQSATTSWTPPWNTAWGEMGTPISLATNNTTTSSSFADVASSSITFTAVANRRLRASMSGQVGSSTGTDRLDVMIADGSNAVIVGSYNGGGLTASPGNPIAFVGLVTPAAGSFTVKLRIARQSGAGTCFLGIVDGTVPTILTLEDVGPNGNPV